MSLPKIDLSSITVTTRWRPSYCLDNPECFGDSSRKDHRLRNKFMKALARLELVIQEVRRMRLVEYLVKFIPETLKL